ncbi:hypothetical protein H0E87_006834 [Populus deltoides]|uniref:ACB domain-containing protein n=1 Tax=Populus deltoides TaxID=3696 RepID=A0A8T2Z8Q6_POPDE|nr:hypothetical protein H0E87_006834 [Populus deltoides]
MGLQEEFEEHAEKAKTLPENTTNENKLILYGLFKQATVGPVNTSRPGIFNMRDRAKWDAWKAVEGIGLRFMVVGYWFIFFDTTVSFFFFLREIQGGSNE